MRNSNLFITGWTRSGTSTIYETLKQHPEIFMSEVKEPRFFGDHPSPNYPQFFKNEKKYLSLFKDAKNEKILGEASHYFDSELALKQIKKFNQKAKIILMLRSPIELIYSEYKVGAIPNDESLEIVLKKNSKKVRNLFKILNYSKIIKKHFEIFGKENVYVMLSDDLSGNTQKELSNLCKFLGINSNFKFEFKKYGVSRKMKNKWIFSLVKKLPSSLKLIIKKNFPKLNNKLKKKVRKFTTKEEIKESLDFQIEKELKRKFKKEIEKTSKLIGKNLEYWTK